MGSADGPGWRRAQPAGELELALLVRYRALDPSLRLRLLAPFADDADAEGAHMIGPGGLRELAAGALASAPMARRICR